MATDYFVKTDGNDGNNGSTWALAKATIQAGMNLCTTAGDRCVVAAGTYYETALTPPSAGTRGTNKVLYGDYDGTVADGGAATSGVTGYVTIDGSLQSGNYGRNTNVYIFAVSDAWAYWDLSNLYCRGADRVQISASTPGTANDGVSFTNIVTEAGLSGFAVSAWTTDSDTYDPITLDRIVVVQRRLYASGDRYNAAMYFSNSKSGGYTTNPNYVLKRCFSVGTTGGLCADGGSTTYTYISATNCSFIAYDHNAETGSRSYSLWGANTSYNKFDGTDCYFESTAINSGITVASNTRPKYYGVALAGSLATMPLLPLISYLYPGSPLIDVSGGGGTYPDLFQVASVQGSDDDCGAQEFVTGQYPLEPTMDISNLTTGTPTPGPSTGGGLSRGRVVNAGGI